MAVVIKNDASDILLEEEFPFDEETMSSPTIVENVKNISYDFGNATFNSLYFDGYHLGYGKAHVYENLHISHSKLARPLVDMLFLQRGSFHTTLDGMHDNLHFSTLEHNLMFTPTHGENAAVEKQDGLTLFTISFTQDRFLALAEHNGEILDRMANNIAGNRPVMLDQHHNPHITPRMNAIIEEMTNCTFQGGLKKLFLQSKALELLALQCSQASEVTDRRTRQVSASDRERLDHARSILQANVQQPPTMAQLARMTGLNEFKLKSGFRDIYNNTVFGYLSDFRLEQARILVLEAKQSLTDIAEDAGFSSLQHFSNAFRKKFGVSPSKLR
ncbi:MAG: helix-turn-helix transcriptional regulator [Chitinophaga sp.]|uniref:helix-turn-helix transcriptional regulator n=1 Tax=Chitinophaga sp. TaxID=1869181 RepID=UPI0025C16366|nr:AraC family transcriptional regulator [Chitinophaga sp.]MBV8252461.1 helix-turn-helix transcriptional regulator [Chitinophaga sp.]